MAAKNPTDALKVNAIKFNTRSVAEAGAIVPLLSFLLTLGDIILTMASFLLAFKLETGAIAFQSSSQGWNFTPSAAFEPYTLLMLFAPLILLATFHYFDMYRLRGEFSFRQELMNVFMGVSVCLLILVMLAFFYRGGDNSGYVYERGFFVHFWVTLLICLGLFRLVIRDAQGVYREQYKGNLIPTIVVGNNELAEMCIDEISGKTRLGYNLIGVVVNEGEGAQEVKGLSVLGTFSNLPAIIKQYGIEEVLIADSRINPKTIFETIMRLGRGRNVDFRVLPDLFNCLAKKAEVQQIGVLPLVKLFGEPLEGFNRFFKRTVDIFASIGAIIGTMPIWLPTIIALKMDSKGPLFYLQERIGMDGRAFGMMKFRSMYANNDDSKHRAAMEAAIKSKADANQGDGKKVVIGKVKNDPRITKVGRFIRKYSIDELPQLINVLKGEMSLVGPRPPIPYEVEIYEDWHRARFHATPGITGLWQVSGRNSLSFDQMIQYDVFYIKNWSIWLDLKILLKTPLVVLKGEDAY